MQLGGDYVIEPVNLYVCSACVSTSILTKRDLFKKCLSQTSLREDPQPLNHILAVKRLPWNFSEARREHLIYVWMYVRIYFSNSETSCLSLT